MNHNGYGIRLLALPLQKGKTLLRLAGLLVMQMHESRWRFMRTQLQKVQGVFPGLLVKQSQPQRKKKKLRKGKRKPHTNPTHARKNPTRKKITNYNKL